MTAPTDIRPQQADRIIYIDEVSRMTGIKENTLRYYRQLAQGDDPKIIGPQGAKAGKRLIWRESDVRAWIDAQFNQAAG